MKINHLFKLYHGRLANPPDYRRARGLCESMKIYNAAGIRDLGSIEPGKVTDLTLRAPGVVVNTWSTSITRGSSILGGRRLDYL